MAESTETVYEGHGATIQEAADQAKNAAVAAGVPIGTKLTGTITTEIVEGVRSDYRVLFTP